jgi:hypothetical protein
VTEYYGRRCSREHLTDAHQAVIDAAVVVARETIDSYGNLAADVTHDVGIAELIEAVRALNEVTP